MKIPQTVMKSNLFFKSINHKTKTSPIKAVTSFVFAFAALQKSCSSSRINGKKNINQNKSASNNKTTIMIVKF